MEIPGNDIRINKNKTVQDRTDVAGKKAAAQKPEPAGQTSGGEQIALSAKAKGIQKALETVQSSPLVEADSLVISLAPGCTLRPRNDPVGTIVR